MSGSDAMGDSDRRCGHGYSLGWCPLGCTQLPRVPDIELDPERELQFILDKRDGRFDPSVTDPDQQEASPQ